MSGLSLIPNLIHFNGSCFTTNTHLADPYHHNNNFLYTFRNTDTDTTTLKMEGNPAYETVTNVAILTNQCLN